jgi:hypothetical protein
MDCITGKIWRFDFDIGIDGGILSPDVIPLPKLILDASSFPSSVRIREVKRHLTAVKSVPSAPPPLTFELLNV